MNKSDWPRIVQVGRRAIGPGEPVYVIAEAGVNHNGDLGRARDMVRAAGAAGADAVKFQAFSAARLTTAEAPGAAYQQAASQRALLEGLELSARDFAALAREADRAGIDWLATPFSPEDLAMLLELGLRAVKLASPDVTNQPLLEAAGQSGRPVLLSTGAATLDEVSAALDVLASAGAQAVALLHCVSGYPVPLEQANLLAMRDLAGLGPGPVGYSDHTTETITGQLAVQAGAAVLEKHFTLDRTLAGPDQAMSLEVPELTRYIAAARATGCRGLDSQEQETLPPAWRAALGDGRKRVLDLERDVRRVARSSVVSAEAIPAGTRIERSMLTIKRPGGGVEPGRIGQVVGRLAAVDIPPDTTLRMDMLT